MRSEIDLREEMCKIGLLLYQRRYIVGSDGNLSVRLPGNILLCTPSGVCKGTMRPEDLIKIDMRGTTICGQGLPSSELLMHLMVYRQRSDVRAVVHAHPLITIALTTVGKDLNEVLIAEVPIHLGKIAVAPYATPGTEDLAKSIEPFLAESDAVVMARHGILTVGKDLADAYYKVEWAEYAAEVSWRAQQVGSPVPLDSREVEKLNRLRSHA